MFTKPTAIWDEQTKRILLYFPYSSGMAAKVRTLPQRKFCRLPAPHWKVPNSPSTRKQIKEWGFILRGTIFQQTIHLPRYPSTKQIYKDTKYDDLLHTPRDFQKYGVAFLQSRGGRAILADQMRVGKSVQSLLWIKKFSKKHPTIVICNATLKETWRREILKWIPDASIYIVNGRFNKNTTLPDVDFYIINYAIIAVKRKVEGINKIFFRKDILRKKPKNVIVDECHHISNIAAQRTKAVRRLKKLPYIIPLSGSPIKDRPIQFFVALNLVAPELFPSYKKYGERYCKPSIDKHGKTVYLGADNIEELHYILKSTVMLRRTRKQVLPDLPEVTSIPILLPLQNPSNYIKAQHGTIKSLNYIFGDKEWEVNTKSKNELEKLKQVAVAEKIPAIIEWVEGILEQEEKIILFATHQKTIDILHSELSKYNPIVIDGRTPQSRRQKIRDLFTHKKKHRIFIGNTQAASEGLDLSVADISCIIELSWSPLTHDQATDRTVNINKKDNELSAYYLIADDTIEEVIINLLDRKRKTISQIMDGKKVEETKLLAELLRHLREYNK